MKTGGLGLVIASAILTAAAGCASAPAKFYTLDATATADPSAPTAPYAIMVGPVYVPAAVDRPEFVVQIAPNQVAIDEFNRWAAPLGDGIARAIAADLATLLGTSDVAVGPLVNFRPAYRVSINVQRFESVQAQYVLIEAAWAVDQTASSEVRSGRSAVRETVRGDDFAALAAAHSRALAAVSADIAAAIRAAAAAPR